jgi:hypothetical protein
MTTLLKRWSDKLLGRGDAAVTVPIFDGALKPNGWLEEAPVIANFEAATDLATDGESLYVADGARVLRVAVDGTLTPVAQAKGPITALAAMSNGRFAVAIEGREICVLSGGTVERSWLDAGGQALRSVNALSATSQGVLLATEGSAKHGEDEWQRDLLSHGQSGRALAFEPSAASGRVMVDGLQWPFGIIANEQGHIYSEAWRHRVVSKDGKTERSVLDNLPGYPSRMAHAAGGGYWLTVFAARTQLIEFVLREPVLRRRMMAEIEPRYWIAPAYASGLSFLEPLQGAGIKQMGVLKPWAPPRSYGLVVRLDAKGLPRYSLHSRVGGVHHGIVAVAECHGRLYALSRGAGRLIAIDLAALSQEFE